MILIIAIDNNRNTVRIHHTIDMDRTYDAIRTIKSRTKIHKDNIHIVIQPYSKATIDLIHYILLRDRFIDNNKWSKEYRLESYRVKTVLSVLGLASSITFSKDDYDILNCSNCLDEIEADYSNVSTITELVAIIGGKHYCSDECEVSNRTSAESVCIVCGKRIKGTYVCCSAKCELLWNRQKKVGVTQEEKDERNKRTWQL